MNIALPHLFLFDSYELLFVTGGLSSNSLRFKLKRRMLFLTEPSPAAEAAIGKPFFFSSFIFFFFEGSRGLGARRKE